MAALGILLVPAIVIGARRGIAEQLVGLVKLDEALARFSGGIRVIP
jgi:hypothetical protein